MNDTVANGNGKPSAPAPGAKAAQETIRSVWSAKDEAELRRLMDLKERVLRQNMQPVLEVSKAIYESVAGVPAERQISAIAEELVHRADIITASLKPFVGEEV